ncbi:hypothetical protein ACZ90_00345 [Streptomyces albus subsp. albus]|nr:hypothetical protein ACZ90_00345 [Streptomyces albus subsp. albus]
MPERNKLTRTDIAKARTMRRRGMTYDAIGKEFGVTGPAIWVALNGSYYKPVKKKVGPRQVYAIRRAYDLGVGTHASRAKRFRISERYAIKIAYRTRWGHLTEKSP